MYCKKCGTIVPDSAAFCSNCGNKLQSTQPTKNTLQKNITTQKAPFFKRTWVLMTLLICLPPLGIILMWATKKEWSKKMKIAFSIVFAIWTLLAFAAISSDTSDQTVGSEYSTKADIIIAETTTMKKIDSNIQDLMNATGRSEDYCTTVWNLMKDYGFESISKITFVTDNGGSCYSYKFSTIGYGSTGMLMLDDNGVFFLSFANTILYDAEKPENEIVNFSNFTLSTSQINKYIVATESVAKQCLLSPKSAKFPSSAFTDAWNVYFSDDVVTVTAYVDADNAFGVQIRSNFTAQFSHSTGELTYFELDGEVLSGSKR